MLSSIIFISFNILTKVNGDYQSEVDRLNLSNHAKYQLMSLRSNLKGDSKYTEFLYKTGRKTNVFRLEVPPEVQYIYLSEKEEKIPILDEYSRTGNIEEVINNLTQKEA